MKKLNLKLAGVFAFSLISISAFAQNWELGGNNFPPLNATNNILGTNINLPIRVVTNGIQRGTWTTGNGLGAGSIAGSLIGDGLSIAPGTGSPASGSLDLWTAGSGTTHIQCFS